MSFANQTHQRHVSVILQLRFSLLIFLSSQLWDLPHQIVLICQDMWAQHTEALYLAILQY